MNKYRCTISFSYDFESAKEFNEAQVEAEKELNKLTSHLLLSKRLVRLEKLRQAKHKLRLGEFKPEDVLPFVSKESKKRDYRVGEDIYSVRMDSPRYFVFRDNIKCVACGLEGTKMFLERSPNDKVPHFNLYAVENGKLILMTKDHMQAKACGGMDVHSNYQCMCAVCNNLKGAHNMPLEKVKELRQIYNNNQGLSRKKLSRMILDAKRQFLLPSSQNHVRKGKRKEFLAQIKSQENTVVTNVDLKIWKTSSGKLIGRSVYEHPLVNAIEITSLQAGEILHPIASDNSRIIVKFSNGDECDIYQGYLELAKNVV